MWWRVEVECEVRGEGKTLIQGIAGGDKRSGLDPVV